ncbi:MAG: Ig domain-containing protein [Bacteroidales bacterium]|nr:Ig domain-containing protein [Bacteroidales bacterium]
MKQYLFYTMAVTIMVSATFFSCKNDDVDALTLDKTSAILAVKSTLTLNVKIDPANARNKQIIWTSDNPSVATVTNGEVSAISDGIAVITATTKNGICQDTCTILATSKTIYMVGAVNGEVILWKNGVLQKMEEKYNTSYVNRGTSIFVSDNDDVYVTGDVNESAKLWKNGILQNLEDGKRGRASSVFVSGSNVYVAGEISVKGTTIATLWKNGLRQNLEKTDSYSYASSVFVSENDVYVVGGTHGFARLWKNGVIQYSGDTNHKYISVSVSGNDIYVVGYVSTFSDPKNWIATLWKNDVAQYLTDENSYSIAYSAFVSENDVYVIGRANGIITLWKNGIKQKLENADVSHSPSVFVSDNNVYVGGFRKLWVNGRVFNLDEEFGYVFVK